MPRCASVCCDQRKIIPGLKQITKRTGYIFKWSTAMPLIRHSPNNNIKMHIIIDSFWESRKTRVIRLYILPLPEPKAHQQKRQNLSPRHPLYTRNVNVYKLPDSELHCSSKKMRKKQTSETKEGQGERGRRWTRCGAVFVKPLVVVRLFFSVPDSVKFMDTHTKKKTERKKKKKIRQGFLPTNKFSLL